MPLLSQWTRKAVWAAVQQSNTPLEDLHSGALAAQLLALSPPRAEPLQYKWQSQPESVRWLCWFDDAYPEVWRHIPDPPLLLTYRGDLQALARPAVAIVGARRATSVGRELASRLAQALAERGMHIVSGLAYGIDAAAHQGALRADGLTSACLGAGVLNIYPSRHVKMAEQILLKGGALFSEYPLWQPPFAFQFPERNRLISGLANAVVVVEAGERSGSLITARLALEQGRDVYAVPGPVHHHTSIGPHRLIQQGAALVTSADDVLALLDLDLAQPSSTPSHQDADDLDQGDRYVLGLLGAYPLSVDELVTICGWPVAKLTASLGRLEIGGFVRLQTDGYIARP